MIGGGMGSGYPKWAAQEFFRRRREQLDKADPKKKKRFIDVRSPETFRRWAEDAKLPNFEVVGKGAFSAAEPRAGQGIELRFTKEDTK